MLSVLCLLAVEHLSDPVEILKRLSVNDRRNNEVARQYTFVEHVEDRELAGTGGVRKVESKTREVTFLYGRPYRRLVKRNGKPLAGHELSKEEEKYNKEAEKRRRESESARRDETEKERKQQEEFRKLIDEIPRAYHLRLEGVERIDDRDVYRVLASPRSDYRRFAFPYNLLTKMRGTLWIDVEGYQIVKIEAEVIETMSFGLILARVSPGTRLSFEQTRVNGEVWLPHRVVLYVDGRLGLVKKVRAESSTTWSEFRKFQTDSRIVDTGTQP